MKYIKFIRLSKKLNLLVGFFVFCLKAISVIFLIQLTGIIVLMPETQLNLENYRYMTVVELIAMFVLPVISFAMIIYIQTSKKYSFIYIAKGIWGDFDLTPARNELYVKSILKVIIVIFVGYLYISKFVLPLWWASRQEPQLLHSNDCLAYQHTFHSRRRYMLYTSFNVIVEKKWYTTNKESFSKLTGNKNPQVNILYPCARNKLFLLPALNAIIDVQ